MYNVPEKLQEWFNDRMPAFQAGGGSSTLLSCFNLWFISSSDIGASVVMIQAPFFFRSCHQIKVEYMSQKITIPEGYELKKINDSEYQIVKKEPELPNSWSGFCKSQPIKKCECLVTSDSEYGIFPKTGRDGLK